jgi:hypothetical protein
MNKDGDLRNMFRSKLTEFHWVSIESTLTGAGIPDANYCYNGYEGWVEFKRASATAVAIDKLQVAYHERRARVGGHTFLAVRLFSEAGPRRGAARDELFIYRGTDIRQVFLNGLRITPIHHSLGGPSRWNWSEIKNILIS